MPFRDFVGPGRRRTDHPIVVGTIVLCLGIITITSMLTVVTILWAGSQVKEMIALSHAHDAAATKMREGLILSAESQAIVLRRLCLNLSHDDREKDECKALAPPITLKGASGPR